ncbi:MAG: hypothetical protein P1P86_16295, partial [Bacteroidales bacterium]|nr:hypothetical protein [Bacteroidales bacterium]
YHDLFREERDPEKDKTLADLNALMALVMTDINAGNTPDIEEAARLTGVDPETARSLVESVMDRLENIPRPEEISPGKSPGKSPFSPNSQPAPGKKQPAASKQLPVQTGEGIRLLNSDDKLLFDLHLYMMADEIRRLAPWEVLYETEMFGVQVPGTDRVYFVSVMGNEGEFRALSFYKGYEGLTGFLDYSAHVGELTRPGISEKSMLRASTMIGNPICIPHLMLSFVDREELEKEDLAAIRKSGKSFRGKGNWPQFGEFVPGCLPVYPSRETLTELYLVLKQTLLVLERALGETQYLLRDGDPDATLLVRVPTGKGPRFGWKDHYLVPDRRRGEPSYSVNIDPKTPTALSRLPEASQVLQLDLFMLPAPVKEKGSRAYFPFVLLMVEKGNGLVRSSSILVPQPDLRSMYESLPQRVLGELVQSGHRPSKIEIRTDLLFEILPEILEKAGCRVEWVEQMPEMDEAIESLISHLT